MTEKSTKFVKIIVFWCIVLVHTNSNYELDVHFRGMTISTEKPTKPVNSRRYHKIIYDNGKYYQIFPFWGGRGRKFKSCHSDQNRRFNRTSEFSLFYGLFRDFGCLHRLENVRYFLPKIGSKSTTTTCLTTFVTKKPYSIRVFGTLRFLFYAK